MFNYRTTLADGFPQPFTKTVFCAVIKAYTIFEPPHDKTNKMACAPSEDSDQPGNPLCAQLVAKDPSFLHADSEDSDQTGRMPRLILIRLGGCPG